MSKSKTEFVFNLGFGDKWCFGITKENLAQALIDAHEQFPNDEFIFVEVVKKC